MQAGHPVNQDGALEDIFQIGKYDPKQAIFSPYYFKINEHIFYLSLYKFNTL